MLKMKDSKRPTIYDFHNKIKVFDPVHMEPDPFKMSTCHRHEIRITL